MSLITLNLQKNPDEALREKVSSHVQIVPVIGS